MQGEPQLHFHYLSPHAWTGKSIVESFEESDELRKRLKVAAEYTWDSTRFYIDDIFGHPAVQISFYKDMISLWNAKNGVAVPFSVKDMFSEEDVKNLTHIVHMIGEGLTQCQSCLKWVGIVRRFSFAGGVCSDCYDPKKHLPPYTRGD